MSPARYHFLSWVREGLASAIGEPESIGTEAGPTRSSLKSTVTLNGAAVPTPADLAVIGPADVIGFDSAQVVRMFPLPGTAEAEPTMFPLVEFDRPDLPWLATPRHGAAELLRPWLCLVAVAEDELKSVERRPNVDVPVLVVASSALPDPGATHLWAHAQLLLRDEETVGDALAAEGDPARTVSRLVCPRLLRADTRYLACVVPTFAATVAAVLHHKAVEDLRPAWKAGDPEVDLPIFASWGFTTGAAAGGFEELVEMLRGRPLPDGVGRRSLDLARTEALRVKGVETITHVESALRAPGPDTWESTAAEHRQKLAQLVAVGAVPAAEINEPVVAPPLYGSHYALARVADPDGEAWIDALNVDPRERVAAGLGTTVVQREQEALMEQAWRQLAAHQEAERLRVQAVFARSVGESLHGRHLQPLELERAFTLTAPVHARVGSASATVSSVTGAIQRSCLPNATQAMSFRRALRPRGEIAARIGRISPARDGHAGFAEQLTKLPEAGLAQSYKAPDGTLALAADPRDLFADAALETVKKVFAEHAVAEGAAGLEALSSSIAANAKLASISAEALAALPVPDDLASSFAVADVAQLAHARLTIEPGGVAEELVTAGFALQLANGSMFAAPTDDAGRFVPVGIHGEQISVLSAHQEPIAIAAHRGVRRLREAALDPNSALAIVGAGKPVSIELRSARLAGGVPVAQRIGAVRGIGQALALQAADAVHIEQAAGRSPAIRVERALRGIGGVKAEEAAPVTEVVAAEQGVPAVDAFNGIAAASIGEFHLAAGAAAGAVVDRAGVASALVKWAGAGLVSIHPEATLDRLPAFIGSRANDLAASVIGATVGLGSIPVATAPARETFSLSAEVAATRLAVKPDVAVRCYLARAIVGRDAAKVFEPDMWTPTFPDPMWKALSGVSTQWILAGLEHIPPNTATLVVTNPRFIEAYLVGLNHEFGREMVWREFPTDQGETSFASFWGLRSAATQQQVPDITPIGDWKTTKLGKHRPEGSGTEDRLVLVIRGDLLRRYPGTIIFAAPDKAGRADFAAAPKLPVFQGALGDEYRFVGFDLGEDQARSENWWFVFAEQPTEPRFGLDLPDRWGEVAAYERPQPPGDDAELIDAATWNNASWANVVAFPDFRVGMHAPAQAPKLALDGVVWGAHAADVARITFQQPVRASLSALTMLPPEDAPQIDLIEHAFQGLIRQQRPGSRKTDG